MALTFIEAKATLDTIAERALQNKGRLDKCEEWITQAVADLTAMTTEYNTFITELNDAAAANPGEEAWQLAKAEKGQIVSDFQDLKARAQAMQTALGI